MPTSPTQPNGSAAIERLTLGVDSPRGSQPSSLLCDIGCYSFCFDAGASSLLCGVGHCACFEMED